MAHASIEEMIIEITKLLQKLPLRKLEKIAEILKTCDDNETALKMIKDVLKGP